MPAPTATIGDPQRRVTVHTANEGRLPPLGAYIGNVWRRRRFVLHMARSNLKAAHADTVFGQLWQLLNPLLLGLVYYVVVSVLRGGARGGYLPYLMGGLFLYYFVRRAVGNGAIAIVSGSGLMLNSAFPRVILPLSTTLAATLSYLPTFVVYLFFHVTAPPPADTSLHATMLLLPVLLLPPLVLFVFGLSMLSSTVTVYFRDTTSFLPYMLRIWLYLSPVLLTYDEVRNLTARVLNGGGKIADVPEATIALADKLVYLNPMVGYLGVWHALVGGEMPPPFALLMCFVWAAVAVAVGGWFFLTREREFAFRV